MPCARAGEGPILFVFPARYTLVKLGFDLASIRDSYLVSFEKGKIPESPILHVWNKTANDWMRTDLDTYAAGRLFAVAPTRAFIIGNESDVPGVLPTATAFCPDVKSIPSMSMAIILNTLHESLKFKKGEWSWLAERHQLQITDLNEERRRFGRYGKPGGESPHPVTPAPAAPSGEESVKMVPLETPSVQVPLPTPSPAPGPAPVANPAPAPAADANVPPIDIPAMDK